MLCRVPGPASMRASLADLVQFGGRVLACPGGLGRAAALIGLPRLIEDPVTAAGPGRVRPGAGRGPRR